MAVGPPLGPVAGAIRSLLVETVDLSDKAGWKYLQDPSSIAGETIREEDPVAFKMVSLPVRRGPPL